MNRIDGVHDSATVLKSLRDRNVSELGDTRVELGSVVLLCHDIPLLYCPVMHMILPWNSEYY